MANRAVRITEAEKKLIQALRFFDVKPSEVYSVVMRELRPDVWKKMKGEENELKRW